MPIPKRVSSLLVTADLAAVRAFYDDLGLRPVETDDPGCVGYLAGETGVILADRDFATRCWGDRAAAALDGKFVPYVFVDRIETDSATTADVLADTKTWFGTHEQVITTISGPVVFAEVAR